MGKVAALLIVAGAYLEESGLPMPVPSEVSITYLAHRLTGNPLAFVATWLALTALIVLGSTNLFAASRHFGPRLVFGRAGAILHLTPCRLDRAHRWFRRWGPLAIVVSRFVPGLRWAMEVACGTLQVSYRTFWLSTALAAALWIGGLLTLGVTVGETAAGLIAAHPWLLLALPLPALAVVASMVASVRAAPAAPPP